MNPTSPDLKERLRKAADIGGGVIKHVVGPTAEDCHRAAEALDALEAELREQAEKALRCIDAAENRTHAAEAELREAGKTPRCCG